jgi:predicted HTH domain antitoxin
MSSLKLELPPEVTEAEAKLFLALKLHEVGRLTLGKAAKLAGLSKRTFMEVLGKQGLPVFAYPPGELREEVGS